MRVCTCVFYVENMRNIFLRNISFTANKFDVGGAIRTSSVRLCVAKNVFLGHKSSFRLEGGLNFYRAF